VVVEVRGATTRALSARKVSTTEERTAEALGLERSHLYRKMKSLGISSSDAKD